VIGSAEWSGVMDVDRFRLRNADAEDPALQVAMPVVSNHDGHLRCVGTAFAVAPGLAITAAHVVRDWEDDQERTHGFKDGRSKYTVVALQWFGARVYEWHVDEIQALWTADVAFLRFVRPPWWGDGPDQVKPRCGRLNINPPSPGEEIRVFGFPNSFVDENHVLNVSPAVCWARVREVALKTDLRIRPTSYVELEGEIRGGMSGGPCFDKDGSVIGMASRGWDFLEETAEAPPLSYMALLWPAMGMHIDPFKTGGFPAWDLFKEGTAKAIGNRRLRVTAEGIVQLGTVDPDNLVPLPESTSKEHLQGAVDFCAENARRILNDIQNMMELARASTGRWDANPLHRSLRYFFWELDAAVRLAIRLAGLNAGVADGVVCWDDFVVALQRCCIDTATRDLLAALSFSWHGVDLFEIRTYGERARADVLTLLSVSGAEGQVLACRLHPCRRDGQQVDIPNGLERFYEAAKRFSQRLLRISLRIASSAKR
jgi:hypothetical protein